MRQYLLFLSLAGIVAASTLTTAPLPVAASETGMASIHGWRKVGRKTCLVDHDHSGTGSGSNRKIAERGRYPAIDLLRSVSRSLPEAASDDENMLIGDARRLLGVWDRAELMIQAGLYAKGSDPQVDEAIRVWPTLDGFLAEMAPADGVEGSFQRLKVCLGRK